MTTGRPPQNVTGNRHDLSDTNRIIVLEELVDRLLWALAQTRTDAAKEALAPRGPTLPGWNDEIDAVFNRTLQRARTRPEGDAPNQDPPPSAS